MTRGIPSHPVLAAMLALALLVGLGLPASAAPNTVVGTGDSVTVTESLAAIDGPGHHFGFSQSSVLAQTTGQQTIIALGQPASLNTTATQDCTGTTTTDAGGVCTITGQVAGSWTDTGSGNGVVTATEPTPVNPVAPINFARTTIGTETLTAGVGGTSCNPNPPTAGATISCTFTTVGDLLAGANTVVIRFSTPGGAVDLTGTVTAAVTTALSPTAATALPVLTAGGFTGVATNQCATRIGQTCQVTGAVTGTATITGSASWTLTVAAAPAGALANVVPVAFVLTTTNAVAPGEGPFPCAVLPAVGGATTCNFVSTGNPLIGNTVAVCFATAAAPVCVFGTVAPGIGNNINNNPIILPNLPILPPPPLEFIPPPPPPLLPPPPPAPLGAMAAPRAAFPDVPVIPEADSLFLVVGGLVALGGLAGYRSLRRRRDDDIA
jgi:hypothetical protein